MPEKRRLLREHATLLFMAQLLYCHVVAFIVVEKSTARQIATTIYSLRTCVENMVSQIFKKAEKRSTSVACNACKADPIPGRRTRSRLWPMADGECHMMIGLCELNWGGRHEGESSEPMPALTLGQGVEQNYQRVIWTRQPDRAA